MERKWLNLSAEDMKKFLIEKFQEVTPKKNWREIRDIYEYNPDNGLLYIWGNDGWYREFVYTNDENWEIHVYPRDIRKKRFWHGYGKGWEDIE